MLTLALKRPSFAINLILNIQTDMLAYAEMRGIAAKCKRKEAEWRLVCGAASVNVLNR